MRERTQGCAIVIERVTDPQGPADVVRAFDLILKAADGRQSVLRESDAEFGCAPSTERRLRGGAS